MTMTQTTIIENLMEARLDTAMTHITWMGVTIRQLAVTGRLAGAERKTAFNLAKIVMAAEPGVYTAFDPQEIALAVLIEAELITLCNS
tara:strand:+ start:3572 stop:3835 length:264 start_codon:yes stop_codon:yes gene_type:complete